jgi:hypothetical protein
MLEISIPFLIEMAIGLSLSAMTCGIVIAVKFFQIFELKAHSADKKGKNASTKRSR